MTRTLSCLLAGALVFSSHAASAQPIVENYFECKTNKGVTFADVVAFKNEYEAAVQDAGIEGYNLKVMFPVYHSKIGSGQFTWYGSFANNQVWAEVTDWFNGSDWPPRFFALMTCESSSLWRAHD